MPQTVSIRISSSPEETHSIGRELATGLRPGGCVALHGELGSGKTCLIQGICGGLKVTDRVTSPTFILINEYAGKDAAGAYLPVYHFDLYRLAGPDDLLDLGCDDYFYGTGVCLIEWAERGGKVLPPDAIHIHIEATGQSSRKFNISYPE